ncbi:MAG: sel1 repeat family protein [Proteobacteria bacterium]|nr:sel1 repeat family protein [Pseudomonadota bacterium]
MSHIPTLSRFIRPRFIRQSATALLLLAAPLFSLLASTPAWAAPEDLVEVHKMELDGNKVGAFLRLKELAPEGDPIAQWKLAGYYHYGDAGPANFAQAREWYGRAARQGLPDAMLGLAVMNARGQGGPVDIKRAFIWLTIASRLTQDPTEVQNINGLRDKYKSEMSSADLNTALAEAMAFQAVKEKP